MKRRQRRIEEGRGKESKERWTGSQAVRTLPRVLTEKPKLYMYSSEMFVLR